MTKKSGGYMNWNFFIKIGIIQAFFTLNPINVQAIDIALTFDDFPMADGPLFTLQKRTELYCSILKKHRLKAVFFCIGAPLKNKNRFDVIKTLDENKQLIANHSMHHIHSSKQTEEEFELELKETESILSSFKSYRKWFRFPYLDYGNKELIGGSNLKMQRFLTLLEKNKYQEGFVTISTFDWVIQAQLKQAIDTGCIVDYKALEDVYLSLLKLWIQDRIQFYEKYFPEKQIAHTLLLHANDLNALYLEEIIHMIKQEGWSLTNPEEVFVNNSWREEFIKNQKGIRHQLPSMGKTECEKLLRERKCFIEKKPI